MANKRVSELNELLAGQVEASDLIMLTDVSAFESKRIRASELKNYIAYGTGSFASSATSASHANTSNTASYLAYNGVSNGTASYGITASYAVTASWTALVESASYASASSWSDISSHSNTSDFATTASYALTASVNLVVSSALADRANSASYLIYTEGFNNGTSSQARSASYANSSDVTKYVSYDGTYNGIVSTAISATHATSSDESITSSYLDYNGGDNGTASFAISSSYAQWSKYVQSPMVYGYYVGAKVSSTEARIDTMSFVCSNGNPSPHTLISVNGSVILPFTSSQIYSGSISLMVRDQSTETDYELDKAWVEFSAFGTPELISGSISQTFALGGEVFLAGQLILYVTASTPTVYLDDRSSWRFKVESESDDVQQL
jgi:hypothetical protein